MPRAGDGRRVQLCLSARTRSDLEQKIAASIADGQRGFAPRPNSTRMREIFAQWLQTKSTLALTTYDSYAAQIRLYLEPSLGNLKVSSLSQRDVQLAIDAWVVGKRFDNKPGVRAARTVRLPITVLHMVMDYAVALGLCNRNPVNGAVRPKHRKGAKNAAGVPLATQILEAMCGTEMFVPIWTAFTEGLRRGELVGLSRGDVDFETHSLAVRNVVACRGARTVLKPPKSPKSNRIIPLPDVTTALLHYHIVEQTDRLSRLGISVNQETPLFDNGFGDRWHPDTFGREYRRILRGSPSLRLSLRSTRHSFTSMAASLGSETVVISDILGHESSLLTADVYTKVQLTSMLAAVNNVSKALLPVAERQLSSFGSSRI